MSEHILSPMDGAGIPAGAAGEWQQLPSGFSQLQPIAQGLLGAAGKRPPDCISIPDVWASIEVFRIALTDPTRMHPLREQAVQEWRALLALFALNPRSEYALTTELLQISPDPGTTWDRGRPDQRFRNVLNLTRPHAVIDPGAVSWNQIAAIVLDGVLAGFMVPSTLVAPARAYHKNLRTNLPWIQGGYFSDPSSDDLLHHDQYLMLHEYLNHLEAHVERAGDSGTATAESILGELREYRHDVAGVLAGMERRGRWDGATPNFTPYPTAIQVPKGKIFQGLRQSFEPEGERLYYRTLIPARPEIADADKLKGAILIDFNLPGQWGLPGHEIDAWSWVSLERLEDDPALLKTVRHQMAEKGILTLTPEELFLPTLAGTSGTELAGHSGDFRHYLLPLNPVVLLLLSPQEINERLTITQDGSARVVELSLDLHSSLDESRPYTIRKVYQEHQIESWDPPTTLGVWPDFDFEAWDHYFVYCVGSRRETFLPSSAVNVESLSQALDGVRRADRVAVANSLASHARLRRDTLPLEHGTDVVKELHLLDSAPEALVCVPPEKRDERKAARDQNSIAGLMLFQQFSRVQSTDDTWKVGIDFGTTNTSVYYKKNLGQPAAITFSNRILTPYALDLEYAANQFAEDFIPHDDLKIPFQSILRDRRLTDARDVPLWDDHINYVTHAVGTLEDLAKGKRQMRFDLKWSESMDDRERIQLFLSQVALQSLAEAAVQGVHPKNVSWMFSYPEAFTHEQLAEYQTIYPGVIEKARNRSGNLPAPVRGQTWGSRTESLSTALYFQAQRAGFFPQSVITIDVGGHTTDVTIWQNNKLIWRNSLEFAGHHMLGAYLASNLDFFKDISKEDTELRRMYELLCEIASSRPDELLHGIDVVVNSSAYLELLETGYAKISGVDHVRGLKRIAEFSLVGVLHYLAGTVRFLMERGVMENARPPLAVCIGGRSGQLFRNFFEDTETAPISAFFKSVSGYEHSVDVFKFSGHPKHEVAHGLLVETSGATNLDIDTPCPESIVGESLMVGGVQTPATGTLNDLDPERPWEVESLPEIARFVAEYKRFIGRDVSLESLGDRLVGAVNTALRDAQAKARINRVAADDGALSDEVVVAEPPFIVAFRSLVELMISEKVKIGD